MRFLVTRLKYLGDIVLSTPLLETLRDTYPDARIDYLACAPHAEVLRGQPVLDRLYVLPARPSVADMARMAHVLREGPRIDWAFDLWSGPRSAILVTLSGARQRVGLDRGVRARLFQHRRGEPDGDPSAIRYHLDRLAPLLGSIPPSRPTRLRSDATRSREAAQACGLESGGFTLLHPGSTWPDKAWPVGRWPELMAGLNPDRCGKLVVLTPPGDPGVARAIADQTGAQQLPELSIPELAALLPAARLYIGNDGGVLHMSVAFGVPTVGLFGPTDPAIWFPYESLGPFRVVHGCGPDVRDADGNKLSRLGPISVESVAAAVDEVLDQSPGREA